MKQETPRAMRQETPRNRRPQNNAHRNRYTQKQETQETEKTTRKQQTTRHNEKRDTKKQETPGNRDRETKRHQETGDETRDTGNKDRETRDTFPDETVASALDLNQVCYLMVVKSRNENNTRSFRTSLLQRQLRAKTDERRALRDEVVKLREEWATLQQSSEQDNPGNDEETVRPSTSEGDDRTPTIRSNPNQILMRRRRDDNKKEGTLPQSNRLELPA
ncbi:uncharacterized protein LOC135208129 [Macrobrachium nipponense]|uniref:uncharacterized protein LOC135208129 n=1 Tax=Macrobrachium nipponense TaxID=159736 RepID=UPI0030C86250